MSRTCILRTVLYGRVWSEPMSRLADEFGISDVGLAKVCRKHSIPCPPRGHWTKKAAGQEVTKNSLPDAENDFSIEIRGSLENGRERPTLSEPDAGPPVDVRDHLRGAHPLVAEANQTFQIAEKDSEGFLVLAEDAPLSLRVAKSTLRRGLFIMDALLRALELRGHQVSRGPTAVVQETPVSFRLVESVETYQKEPEEPHFEDRYEFGHSRFRKSRRPSGKLAVEIHSPRTYWFRGSRSTWRDTPTKTLEQRLDQVLAGLIEFAHQLRAAEQRERLEEERRRAEEQRRQELAREGAIKRKAIEAEKHRVDGLLQEARNWKRSQGLREFIEAARQRYVGTHSTIEPDSEFARWMEWAANQADRLDPLKESPPSILDEKLEAEADDRRHGHW